MTTDEISRLLRQEIKVISDARATVSVRDYASHGVVVTGIVDSPGKKFLRRESMPLYAVIAEALPRPEGTIATIIRNGNTQSFSMTDNRAMATVVLPGDVIKISSATAATKRFLYVGGDVSAPGERAGSVNKTPNDSAAIAELRYARWLQSMMNAPVIHEPG